MSNPNLTASQEVIPLEAPTTPATKPSSRKGQGAKQRSQADLRNKSNAAIHKVATDKRKTIPTSKISIDSAAILSTFEERSPRIMFMPLNIIGIFSLVRESLATIQCRVPAIRTDIAEFTYAVTRLAIHLVYKKIIRCLVEHGQHQIDVADYRDEYLRDRDLFHLSLPVAVADYIDTIGVFKYLGRTFVPSLYAHPDGHHMFSRPTPDLVDRIFTWPFADPAVPVRLPEDIADEPAPRRRRAHPDVDAPRPPPGIPAALVPEWNRKLNDVRPPNFYHEVALDLNAALRSHFRLLQLIDAKGHSFMRQIADDVHGGFAQLVGVQPPEGQQRETLAWSLLDVSHSDLVYGAALRFGETAFMHTPICYNQGVSAITGSVTLSEAMGRLALKGATSTRVQK
jgi:hypothetical protein